MMKFNFLQTPQQSFWDRLRDLEITAGMRRALVALTAAVSLVVLASAIEQTRLVRAHENETANQARLQSDERSMSSLRAAEQTVTKLSALAQSIREVQNSGTLRAVQFAEIGDRLPPHAWLTSIHQDGDGLLIHGGARNYAIVGDAIGRLAHARTVGTPILVSSGALDNQHPDAVDYEVRLQERAP